MLALGKISFLNLRNYRLNVFLNGRSIFNRSALPNSYAYISPAISKAPFRRIFSLVSQKRRDEISARVAADRILWSNIYYDPRIIIIQMFSRFKLYQTCFTIALILVGYSIILNREKQNKHDQSTEIATGNKESLKKRKKRVTSKRTMQSDSSDSLSSIIAGVALCSLSLSLLFAFNYYFRRIVGVVLILVFIHICTFIWDLFINV